MSETIMKLNNDGRIVQIDNVSWSYYIDVDRARSLEDHKSGKWMHFFNDIQQQRKSSRCLQRDNRQSLCFRLVELPYRELSPAF